ncbi:MAG: hypothetical protein J0I20_34430, partial [Chloroflexi bacterium]|nr:hypothetical protein [Chloroflexota bacterium]
MKSTPAVSAHKFSIPVLSSIFSKFRFFLAYLMLAGVALALGAAAIWFMIPSTPVDPLLHTKSNIPMTMFMVDKVTLLTDDGAPASNAVAVLNNEQQAQADANGVVYFSDVMLHDHNLSVVYKGEHYNLAWHVHSADKNVLALGMSVEFRRTIGYIFSGIFFAWLFFVVVVLSKLYSLGHLKFVDTILARRPRMTKASFIAAFKTRRAFALLGVFVLSVMAATLALTVLSTPNSTAQAAGDVISTLAVPTNLKVEQDDNNAVLSWGDPVGPGYSDPPNVTGYKVTWGLAGSSAAPTVQLTSER